LQSIISENLTTGSLLYLWSEVTTLSRLLIPFLCLLQFFKQLLVFTKNDKHLETYILSRFISSTVF